MNSVGHLPLKSLEFAKGLSRLYRRAHANNNDYADADAYCCYGESQEVELIN